MQTHAPSSTRLFALIGFSLTSVILAILVYVSFGGTLPFTPQPYEFSLVIPDSGNLVQGSDVEESGVTIGHVRSITRDGNAALAQVGIDSGDAPVRADTQAILRTKTLLGETYIAISSGTPGSPALPDGARLPSSQVKTAVPLDQFLSGFNPKTLANFRSLFKGLATALHGQPGNFNGSLQRGAPVTSDISDVMQTLGGETGQLQTLFGSTGQMMTALGARAGDLQAAVRAGDAVLTDTASRDRALETTFTELPGFLKQVQSTGNVLTANSSNFNRAMQSLVPVAELITPTLRDAVRYGPALRRLFTDLPATIRAGKTGLPAVSSMISAIPDAFTNLYPALRQLIPLIQLLAAYSEEGVVGPLSNAASALGGIEVGPGGRIIARPSNSLYVSNESIAGWVKRLPTDRSNPYPTPTGTEELGKIGYLKSYDCRNVNNPNYLPPLGSGVPPCLTQGKWTWQGVTAYYPRLQEAKP